MITQHERDILAKKIFECAFYFGKTDISRDQISKTIDLFESFFGKSLHEYLNAFDAYILDSKNKFYPTPAQLRPYLTQELDDDTKAVEVASRVVAAVSNFGSHRGIEAKTYIGDLGWEAVRRFGGWNFICSNLGENISMTTFQAQIREVSKAVIKTAKVGSYDAPIGLPGAEAKVLSLINIKSLNEPESK